MARVRGAGTGLAVALVIFGCGFVITLLVAIIFYTKIEKAEAGELTAINNLEKYVSKGEQPEANKLITPGTTVYRSLVNEVSALKDELAKEQDKVKALESEKGGMNTAYDQLASTLEAAQAKQQAESDTYKQFMSARQSEIDKLSKEKLDLGNKIGELQQKVTAAIGDADAAAQQRIAELNEEVNALDNQIDELEIEKAELARLAAEAIDKLPKLPRPDTTPVDGKVASVIGGGGDLFISLGRSDGLVIGMNFEVFNPDPVIKLSDQGEARGKATIEVYRLDTDSATCRIVRRERGARIDPGDPIVNLGYDPNMDIAIFAFGYFDIERDGGTSDLSRINTLIIKSGARLAELSKNEEGIPVLTPDLDYIVLGTKPEVPEAPEDATDPEIYEAYQAKLREVNTYFKILEEAKLMRIPVLNQSRFLPLVGYYER